MFTTLFKSNSRKLPNKHLSEFEKKEALNKTCFVQNLGLEIGLPVNGWNFGASHISQVGMTTFLPVRTFQRQTLIRVQTIGQLGPSLSFKNFRRTLDLADRLDNFQHMSSVQNPSVFLSWLINRHSSSGLLQFSIYWVV